MRLIDADGIKYRYAKLKLYDGTETHGYFAFVTSLEIDEAPTIEAEPVRHGEWVDKPSGAYGRMQSWCTACGKHSGIGGIESNRHKPYCPNCGAKMDGKEMGTT